MHFRYAKIMVATSVCTGDRHCPPDSAIEMGSNPANKTDLAKDYSKGNPWLNGPDDRIRTCGILLPKPRTNVFWLIMRVFESIMSLLACFSVLFVH